MLFVGKMDGGSYILQYLFHSKKIASFEAALKATKLTFLHYMDFCVNLT